MNLFDRFFGKQDAQVIQTPCGEIQVFPAPTEVRIPLRAALRFGFVGLKTPIAGGSFGIVMKCAEEEVLAVKQQYVELPDEEYGELQFNANHILIAGALKRYLANGFSGLLIPVAYRRNKSGGRVEAGIAYFGQALSTGKEAALEHVPPWDDHFGRGFSGMINRFIQALAETSAATRIPLQTPIIGMDIRKRLQLETITFGFLVHGPDIVYLGTRLDSNDLLWKTVREGGITEIYHLPSVSIEIDPNDLHLAKPESM